MLLALLSRKFSRRVLRIRRDLLPYIIMSFVVMLFFLVSSKRD